MGAFLKDDSALDDRHQQSVNAQSIRGIFEYDGVDTHHEEIGEKRIVAFLSGESIDYLKLVDFKFDRASETFLPKDVDCEPLFGICIPGEEFSPVILRSDSYRTRQLGLLYTPENLVEINGEMPDELVYEVFTTNKDQLGSNSNADDISTDGLFLQALNLHFGPRLKRDLEPLSNPQEIAKVADIIDQIATEVL